MLVLYCFYRYQVISSSINFLYYLFN
uniref:Uncharacterized protein n=1 Tax=Heterorhabditis bacteriophora TaxID=37862 RepID=A0A1I7WG08_HETBA